MKRLVAVVALCALFFAAAFAVLVTADRQLGWPLPYTITFSFTVVSLAAPIVFAIANALRRRRPVKGKAAAVTSRSAPHLPATAAARRPAEGVVLLDFAGAKKLQERAA